jgi:hypothetical protein
MNVIIELGEAKLIEIISKITNQIAAKFPFGIYDIDDIKSEAFLLAWKVLHKFDVNKSSIKNADSLEGQVAAFLSTHLRNRLKNLWRDKVTRPDYPCKTCHSGDPCTPGFCEPYRKWYKRNHAKASLASPSEMGILEEGLQSRAEGEHSELEALIDKKLPVRLRGDYLRLRAGVKMGAARRKRIAMAVRTILRSTRYER